MSTENNPIVVLYLRE